MVDLNYTILSSDQLADLKKIIKADVTYSIKQKIDPQSINQKKLLLIKLDNEIKVRKTVN